MDPLKAAAASAYSGLTAQSMRLRIVSENIANVESTGKTPGSDPYRRKTISFAQTLDEVTGASIVKIAEVGNDPSAFIVEHDPGHPAADAKGNVKRPNVNMIVEMTDLRQAVRSYEANLNIISATRRMIQRTLDILKA